MNLLRLIEAKRDGRALDPDDLRALVAAYTRDELRDYQMAAFLMAVVFRGLNDEETAALTLAMRDSGRVLSFPPDGRPVVDKHSTGGVGDKVSLPLAPLLAALGFRVPMVSGRGLGITGGTLDKLEAIPGFSTALSSERIVEQTLAIGCALAGQSEQMAPADRRMYALRDATGTVPSASLITASILSKKLAEGLDALILDVKVGAAATLGDREAARDLARSMVALGRACGLRVRALITAMDAPLGRAVGNLLEVREAVECLRGGGPEDLRLLVIECAAHLLNQTGRADTVQRGRHLATERLDEGAALRKWEAILAAQGAALDALARLLERDHTAPVVRDLTAWRGGVVAGCDARLAGEIVRDLGGGRQHKEAAIDPDVGLDRLAAPGEAVSEGALLARVHARTESDAEAAITRLRRAFTLSDCPVHAPPLIREVIAPAD